MKYSQLIKRKKQYKYSANICFDLRNEARIADFIPNNTTSDIIKEYLSGMINETSDIHSRILYGSYGTGKSHLLTVLGAVLAHINTNGTGFSSFVELIAEYDSNLAYDIKKFCLNEKPFLVVPVYSDYADFNKCISFSLFKELERNNIDVAFSGFFEEALSLYSKWISGNESREKLEFECKKENTDIDKLEAGLKSYDLKYKKIFMKIYEGISYGATFNTSDGNLIDNLNAANRAIKDKYKGIVFIFDEFGRYIEDYGSEIKVKSIQDLAEYCDHSDFSNYILLVSHKRISMYTKSMKKSIADEWKKVEGRFKSTSINLKYDQCLSLIKHIIPKTDKWPDFRAKNGVMLNELYNQAWDFKGFLLPPNAKNENPFEGGFPLHPITLYALDRLSKKVAQNERTFFTYLAGAEDYSLHSQLSKLDTKEFHFIGLDSLYDYFEPNIQAYKTDETYVVYKKLQYAFSKIGSKNSDIMKKILKTIAVINIISDTDVIIPDKVTLLNVIDENNEIILNNIEELEKMKVIRFMRQYGFYDFFDSSIFDLEAMIDEKTLGIGDDIVSSTLNESFSDFVIYPHRYNEIYKINRVFLPLFARKTDINKKAILQGVPTYYDGIVLFVLDNNAQESDYLGIQNLPERSILIVNSNCVELENEVRRYIAIQYFYDIREELAKDDPTIVNELKVYLDEEKSIIAEYVRKWRRISGKQFFIFANDQVKKASTQQDLSNIASEIMECAFSRTIIVNNDLINKNNVTGAIKLARRKALHLIMTSNDIYSKLSRLSPEYNIYRAVISLNGIDNSEKVDEEQINRLLDNTIAGEPVMLEINRFLKKAEKGQIALSYIYSSLKRKPFGLRDGYISILIAYALRKYENVFLYFHGSEHDYTEDELVTSIEQSNNYSLYICNWTMAEKKYIESLEMIFKDYVMNDTSNNRLKNLFLAINMHYSSVTKSARTTERFVSEETKQYREILNVSYNDYNKFFFESLLQIGCDLQSIDVLISNIKNELEMVPQKFYKIIERIVKEKLEIEPETSIVEAVNVKYLSEWREKSIKVFNYETNMFLDCVSKAKEEKDEDFILTLAKALTGFEIDYWADEKIADFEETLDDIIGNLNGYTLTDAVNAGDIKIIISSGDNEPIVTQFSQDEFSQIGRLMLNKLQGTIDNFGQSVSHEEKLNIITQIMKEAIK